MDSFEALGTDSVDLYYVSRLFCCLCLLYIDIETSVSHDAFQLHAPDREVPFKEVSVSFLIAYHHLSSRKHFLPLPLRSPDFFHRRWKRSTKSTKRADSNDSV